MDDDAEDENSLAFVRRAVTDSRGRVSWPRITNALRGRATSDADLVPWIGVGLLAVLLVGPTLGYVDHGTVGAAVDHLFTYLLVYLLVVGAVAANRIEEYYEGDEEIAFAELRARYADGDIDLAEFQRRVERVFEEGPEAVFGRGDDGTDDAGGIGTGDGDPVAILRERFARGEIDEAEYRSRVAVLRETTPGAGDGGVPRRNVDAPGVDVGAVESRAGTGGVERETTTGAAEHADSSGTAGDE